MAPRARRILSAHPPTWAAVLRLFLLASLTSSLVSSDDPRAVVHDATRAVQRDSAARIAATWQSRVARNANDRAALLGLATVARLSYDYPTAERLYSRIAQVPDDYAVYAHLGLAEGYESRSIARDAAREFTLALSASRAVGDRSAQADALIWLAFA